MNTITYPLGGYAPVPLSDLPFSGDFLLKDKTTGVILWDSRTDGYDPDGTYLVNWIELVRDDSRTVGSLFLLTVYHPDDIKGGN